MRQVFRVSNRTPLSGSARVTSVEFTVATTMELGKKPQRFTVNICRQLLPAALAIASTTFPLAVRLAIPSSSRAMPSRSRVARGAAHDRPRWFTQSDHKGEGKLPRSWRIEVIVRTVVASAGPRSSTRPPRDGFHVVVTPKNRIVPVLDAFPERSLPTLLDREYLASPSAQGSHSPPPGQLRFHASAQSVSPPYLDMPPAARPPSWPPES